MPTLTLPDLEGDGRITEDQFEALPEPDLFYFELAERRVRLRPGRIVRAGSRG